MSSRKHQVRAASSPFGTMTTTIYMTSLLLLVPSAMAAVGTPCGDFQCQHGSICQDGPIESFGEQHSSLVQESFLNAHQQRSQDSDAHCDCTPTFTGVDCSIPFQVCGDDRDHKCYFGGECFLGLEQVLGEDELFCDCSMARDSQGNRFVGKYCEHLLRSQRDEHSQSKLDVSVPTRKGITECRISGTFDDYMCMFDGECNPGYPAESKQPCKCKKGYTGPHCEYMESTVPDCTLPCQNGGSCTLGRPDPQTDQMAYDFFRRSSIDTDFMWCDCTQGFYGDLCEVSSTPCGEQVCFNDAECIEWNDTSDQVTHTCSCKKSDSASYAGKFCQYEATSYCPAENFEGDFFCANGGHCRSEPWLGCECPPGYSGFSCGYYEGSGDFFAEELQEDPCELDCNGRGSCVFGTKNLDYLGVAAFAEHLSVAATGSFQHCACQNGFTGVECEHAVEQCGGKGEHFCLHGSQCITGDNGEQACDCTTATSEIAAAFAGDYCEHPATTTCPDSSFCVNKGVCNEGLPCICPEGWQGSHCEFKTQQAKQEANKNMKFALRFMTYLTISLLLLVLIAVIKFRFEIGSGKNKYNFLSSRPASVTPRWPSRHGRPTGGDVNLSPLKDSTFVEDDEYTRAFQNNSQIPLPSPHHDFEADMPTLYMGPPTDEDGNILAEVTLT